MITKQELDNLVKKYETPDFIKDDPIQFPQGSKIKKILNLRALLPHYLLMEIEKCLLQN